MKQSVREKISMVQSVIICVVLVIAASIAVIALTAALCIYVRNQSLFSAEYASAFELVKSEAVQPAMQQTEQPATQPEANPDNSGVDAEKMLAENTDNSSLQTKINYLERLHLLHKGSTTTDLFVFIYGFLSSILIGLGTYFVYNSKVNSEESKKNYDEMQEQYKIMSDSVNSMSAKVVKFEDILFEAATDLKMQKITHRALLALNLIMNYVICITSETGNGVIQDMIFELAPRFNENMRWLEQDIQSLSDKEITSGDIQQLIASLEQIRKCVAALKDQSELFDESFIKEMTGKITQWVERLSAEFSVSAEAAPING